MKQQSDHKMPSERQIPYMLAIIDVWLPLLMKGDITQVEFKQIIEAASDTSNI